ncbi:VCBS repeat-containing protein [Streptomyces sp. ME01-24h]|nr:VCBS repeat-containing protein [Streptomyces sp. ME19-03-3]MDX3215137.1 VCBS repeat-containing protein [Streptomyces sp. ME02-6991-2B]MDX3355919.1 VCBS repeat-containing protein [Streptomyces sp. ME01-24h]
MLLAAPASADDATTPPAPALERPAQPRLDRLPTLTLPKHTTAKSPALRAAGASAANVPAKPRLDLDDDGYTDLMYRAIDGQLYVEPANSADSHVYTINGDYEEQYKDIIAPGDLDGGGRPEFFTLSATGTLSLFQSWGPDSTGYVTWSGKGWQIYNKVLAPGDLNGDGRGDVVARTPAGELYIYTSTGTVNSAPLAPRTLVGKGWGVYDQLVGANDMNGDGIGDLLARTTAGELYFYAGTGNAAAPFKVRVKIGNGWNAYNQLIGVDDQTGDGLADLLVRTQSGTTYFYQSTGQGTFLPRVGGGTGWNAASLFLQAGGNPDFGKNELMGLDGKNNLYWYYSKNNGLLSPRQLIDQLWSGVNLTLVSSLDKDGQADLPVVYNGTLYNGEYTIGKGWSIYNSLVGPGDLNGDGKGDLLARDKSGVLYLYRGNGTGSAFATRIKIGKGWGVYNKLLGAGDYTGDGLTDLLARTTGGTLYLYAGTGNASAPFKSRVVIGGGWNTYNKLAAPGDINGDGKGDIVGVNSAGDLYLYTATGTGKFAGRVKIGFGYNTYRNLY